MNTSLRARNITFSRNWSDQSKHFEGDINIKGEDSVSKLVVGDMDRLDEDISDYYDDPRPIEVIMQYLYDDTKLEVASVPDDDGFGNDRYFSVEPHE